MDSYSFDYYHQRMNHNTLYNELADALYNYFYEPNSKMVDEHLQWLDASDDHHIVMSQHTHYPKLLSEISKPPKILFVKGSVELLHQPQIAIVGSRNASPIGLETAFEFAHSLSQAGLTVTSGLALGIDGAAHRGALAANCPTIAVVGTGLDSVYPYKHAHLADQISRQGAIVSEFPLGTTPAPANFPRRNRIISGLSLGTLVVEASAKSRSLITANLAADQGREVFAIPGSIHNPTAKGCHQLINLGAKLVQNIEDIASELGQFCGSSLLEKHPRDTPTSSDTLLESIDFAPTSIDRVIQRSGLTEKDIYSMLLKLELNGHICSIPSGYIRVKL